MPTCFSLSWHPIRYKSSFLAHKLQIDIGFKPELPNQWMIWNKIRIFISTSIISTDKVIFLVSLILVASEKMSSWRLTLNRNLPSPLVIVKRLWWHISAIFHMSFIDPLLFMWCPVVFCIWALCIRFLLIVYFKTTYISISTFLIMLVLSCHKVKLHHIKALRVKYWNSSGSSYFFSCVLKQYRMTAVQ